ncbi:Lpg1974 family pore-forming outer membrane protein [Lacipirellula sp.]|uniref:Lpg1974 family pore-forming outer membrane protein n=1 Tax=Lacipirellula sp. TaxID=2691419 RepID=UPI003D1059BF
MKFAAASKLCVTLRRRAPMLAALVAAIVCMGGEAAAQVMMGADGAVHLDAIGDVPTTPPIIVQQQPQLVGPAMAGGPMIGGTPTVAGGVPWQTAIGGTAQPYGACSVPFAPCAPVAMQVVETPPPILFSFFGEFLYLNPTGVDVAHAQQVRTPGVPLGQIAQTDIGYNPGFRIGGDMAMSQHSSIAASYTYFESDASNSIGPPTINGIPGSVDSLVHFPGLNLGASATGLTARSEFDFQLADLEYRTRLRQGERYWINGGLGLRYGKLEQSFGQTGEFLSGQIDTQSDVDFDGGGMKLALDGGRNIGSRGLSLYGRTSLSPMAGSFRSTYSMTNVDLDSTFVQANWNDQRITTLLDYEVGVAWTGPRGRWRFAAGYTQSFWFNAVTTSDYIDAVQSSNYGGVSDTIMLNGLTARVEHLW